jgi:hypothetical protein
MLDKKRPMKKTLLTLGALCVLAVGTLPAQITNVYLGALPNDGTGDTARTAFGKINNNFAAVESQIGALPTQWPGTSVTSAVANAILAGTATTALGGWPTQWSVGSLTGAGNIITHNTSEFDAAGAAAAAVQTFASTNVPAFAAAAAYAPNGAPVSFFNTNKYLMFDEGYNNDSQNFFINYGSATNFTSISTLPTIGTLNILRDPSYYYDGTNFYISMTLDFFSGQSTNIMLLQSANLVSWTTNVDSFPNFTSTLFGGTSVSIGRPQWVTNTAGGMALVWWITGLPTNQFYYATAINLSANQFNPATNIAIVNPPLNGTL